jgi:hypothetical protein
LDAEWIDFSHQRIVYFRTPGRRVVTFDVTISPRSRPLPGQAFTGGAGNAAVLRAANTPDGTLFDVKNDTCADYFVRVVAHLEPKAPGQTLGLGPSEPSER